MARAAGEAEAAGVGEVEGCPGWVEFLLEAAEAVGVVEGAGGAAEGGEGPGGGAVEASRGVRRERLA